MSIPSASASFAVVVGGRLDSRKSEEEGRRAGSPRGKECDRFDRQLATKARKWGRQVEWFGLQAGSRATGKSVGRGAQTIAWVLQLLEKAKRLSNDGPEACTGCGCFFDDVLHFGAELARERMRVSIIKAVDRNLPSAAAHRLPAQ